MIKPKRLNLGKIYFLYLFFMLFLQLLGVDAKGTVWDTIWKAGLITVTMLYVFRKIEYSIPKYMVVPIMIYIVGQCVAAYLYPSDMRVPSAFTVVTNVAIIISMVYLFLALPYLTKEFDPEDMSLFLNWFIVLMLYAVAYNFIQSPEAFLNVLSNKNVYQDMMSSFFDNKQTFGMFLFMALICCVWQYVRLQKKRFLWAMLLFFINLFVCLSRTALFSCIFFAILLCVLLAGKRTDMLKKIVLAIAIVLVSVLLVPLLRDFIENVVLDTEKTMDARESIWEFAADKITGPQLIFGYMDGNARNVLTIDGKMQYSHNGIIQVLITGGVIKLVLYVLIVIKCLKAISRIRKYDAVMSAVFFASICSVMMYSMGEAVVLFDTSAWCVAATIFCAAFPCAMDAYYQRNPVERTGEQSAEEYKDVSKKNLAISSLRINAPKDYQR